MSSFFRSFLVAFLTFCATQAFTACGGLSEEPATNADDNGAGNSNPVVQPTTILPSNPSEEVGTLNQEVTVPPPGFQPGATAVGVTTYKKDYGNGRVDYVLEVNLKKARLRQFTGPIASQGVGQGPLGGNNPHITRQPLNWFWNEAKNREPTAVAVFNAQFFDPNAYPTPLAFSVKMDGQHLTDGYGITKEFPGQKRTLEWTKASSWARIDPYSSAALKQQSNGVSDIVVGLDTVANKGPGNTVGRTFIGVKDADGEGTPDTMLVLVTTAATQTDAQNVLTGFGALRQVMLDGGGSSQLILNGVAAVSSGRTIPHALAVVAGRACQHYCSDYNFAPGYCQQNGGWRCDCDGQCITQTGCNASDHCNANSCQFYCGDYNYRPGQCFGGWKCDCASRCVTNTNCLVSGCSGGCDFYCSDYNFSAGLCQINGGWQCDCNSQCIIRTGCQSNNHCGFPCRYFCSDYSFGTGQCYQGWSCDCGGRCLSNTGCANNTICGE